MLNRIRVRSLIATSALVVATVLVPASPSLATSNDPCLSNFGWNNGKDDQPKVPIRSNSYLPPGSHVTDCRMYVGLQSAGVTALQKALVRCYGQNITIDGKYGAKTAQALANVQRSHGIKDDGLYGNETRDTIKFFVNYYGPVTLCNYDPFYPLYDQL